MKESKMSYMKVLNFPPIILSTSLSPATQPLSDEVKAVENKSFDSSIGKKVPTDSPKKTQQLMIQLLLHCLSKDKGWQSLKKVLVSCSPCIATCSCGLLIIHKREST